MLVFRACDRVLWVLNARALRRSSVLVLCACDCDLLIVKVALVLCATSSMLRSCSVQYHVVHAGALCTTSGQVICSIGCDCKALLKRDLCGCVVCALVPCSMGQVITSSEEWDTRFQGRRSACRGLAYDSQGNCAVLTTSLAHSGRPAERLLGAVSSLGGEGQAGHPHVQKLAAVLVSTGELHVALGLADSPWNTYV